MPRKRLLLLPLALIVLGACAAPSPWRSEYYRDHKLTGRIWKVDEARFIERAELIAALTPADFILLGETHDNPDHHLLQAQIIGAVADTGRRPVIAFEMFDISQAPALAQYLKESPKDSAGIAEAVGWRQSGWPEWRIYRPIAEAALAAGLELRAANMSRAQARALARSGLQGAAAELVESLKLDRPLPPALQESLKREIEAAHCGSAPAQMIEGMAFAQFARDAYLARAMSTDTEAGGAILITGAGHARRDRAVPFHLRRMAPDRTAISLAFLEVSEGEDAPRDYAAPFESDSLPFDYVWFAPRVDVRDACERFEEQLKAMREEKPPAKPDE